MLPLTVASLYLGRYHGGEGPGLDPPDGWSARGHPAAGGLPGSLHAPSRHAQPITGAHPPRASRGHRPLCALSQFFAGFAVIPFHNARMILANFLIVLKILVS